MKRHYIIVRLTKWERRTCRDKIKQAQRVESSGSTSADFAEGRCGGTGVAGPTDCGGVFVSSSDGGERSSGFRAGRRASSVGDGVAFGSPVPQDLKSQRFYVPHVTLSSSHIR